MGFKFEKQDLMSQDFLPAFVLLAQSETHLDEGWGVGWHAPGVQGWG